MKHWITCLTALLLAALLTATALAANASGYSDVPDGHWAAQSVRRCTQLGLLQGVGGGKFGRGQEMTRAAYAAALCRLMGWQMLSPAKGQFLPMSAVRPAKPAAPLCAGCASASARMPASTPYPSARTVIAAISSRVIASVGRQSLLWPGNASCAAAVSTAL